jgi:hypothetical protein
MTDDAKITATPPPMHPGDVLRDEVIKPFRLSRCHAPELSAASPGGSEFPAIRPSASAASLKGAPSAG